MRTVLEQVQQSILSKQGKTTTTGVFEGTPQNTLAGPRKFTTPTGNSRVDAPIDAAVAFNNEATQAPTYLEHLKREKRI